MMQKKVLQTVQTNVSLKPELYHIGIFDESISFPFCISANLMAKMTKLRERSHTKYEIAKNIFDFVSTKITYGNPYPKRYATSLEVWKNKKGVCGESAFLYTTLARFCGLKSQFVNVKFEPLSTYYNHACSVVYTPNRIFVDITCQVFDMKLVDYQILNDRQVFERFSQWRNS